MWFSVWAFLVKSSQPAKDFLIGLSFESSFSIPLEECLTTSEFPQLIGSPRINLDMLPFKLWSSGDPVDDPSSWDGWRCPLLDLKTALASLLHGETPPEEVNAFCLNFADPEVFLDRSVVGVAVVVSEEADVLEEASEDDSEDQGDVIHL